jgi:hypothetical protein
MSTAARARWMALLQLGVRLRRGVDLGRDEFRYVALFQHQPDDERHLRLLLVDKELGLDEPIGAPLRDDLEAARREDVLHPVRAAPVRQREEISLARSEKVDRCSIRTAGFPALVDDDAEARHPRAEQSDGLVRDDLLKRAILRPAGIRTPQVLN